MRTRREVHADYAAEHGLGSEHWRALGTSVHVVTTSEEVVGEARAAVERVLADVDAAASRFREDSELARVNAARGAWTPIGPMLGLAIRVAVDAAEWTGGMVDPTIGGALIAHGYDRTFTALPVDGPAVAVRLQQVPGWRSIALADGDSRVRVPAGTIIDLGATAKGLAADLAAAAATAATGRGVLVNLGGDVSVDGEPSAEGWPVTVTDVSDPDGHAAADASQTVVITDGGLATSSTRARRWRRGGVELHHLIDPRSSAPVVTPWRTVSVTAATCTLANAASTAAMILGPTAPEWLRDHGMHARLVRHDGSSLYVGNWPVDT